MPNGNKFPGLILGASCIIFLSRARLEGSENVRKAMQTEINLC